MRLIEERDALAKTLEAIEAKVDTLIKERDEYAKAADSMAMQHKIERDELRMQIDSLCHEVDAIPAIKAERDALMSAAKLALDALAIAQNNLASSRAMLGGYTLVWDTYGTAIDTLRQAGIK